MPEHHAHASLGGELEDPCLFDPGRQQAIALRREIDDHAALLVGRERHDLVGALELGEVDGARVVPVEAEEGTVRAVRVEGDEGRRVVDEVLRTQTGDDRLPNAALLSADENEACS